VGHLAPAGISRAKHQNVFLSISTHNRVVYCRRCLDRGGY
jgi:hypothetical protein